MAQRASCWSHIVLKPCYILYEEEKDSSLWVLHSLWDEYTVQYERGPDIEKCMQAWHYMMAVAYIFRERGEWDEKKGCPIPLLLSKPKWKELDLKPGTQEWIEHWKAYPEEQRSMAVHAKRLAKKEDTGEWIS